MMDMFILAINAALDCASDASFAFAPMLNPERTICFEMTNSFFSFCKYSYNLIILKANALLFPKIKLSLISQTF